MPRLNLRGYGALLIICLTLLACDVVQRLVIQPWVRLAPARRIPVLARWQHFLAHAVLDPIEKIGGASIPELPRIPGEPGVLVLMNHQSLLDIPLVCGSVDGAYPRIVTRKRYLRWIPLISHMVRLYQYPVVDPRANPTETRLSLEAIALAARTSDVPLAIFPEGTRTKHGDIGNFKTSGLKMILGARPWKVYVLVADGFWQRAKFKDFFAGLSSIEGRIELSGPLEWDDPEADPSAFIRQVRREMVERLARMRLPAAV